jgi:RNA polymerase-binding transcription factor DksA
MATVKKAAKSAKKAPQPVKKSPAKKAGEKPVAKAAKKATPAKVAPKKATPKKAVPAKGVVKKAASSKTAKPAQKVAVKAKDVKKAAPAKPLAAKKTVVAAKPLASKPSAPAKGAVAGKVNGNGKGPNGGLKAIPAKNGSIASKGTPGKPAQPAPPHPASKPAIGTKPVVPAVPGVKPPPFKAAVAKVEPKSTAITRPVPKPETKLVELKPIKTSVATTVKYEPDFKSVLDEPGQTIFNAPTMRYSDAELGEFKDLIMRKLEAAKKELTYLQGLITRKDEMGGDESENRYMTMEDGSISMEREQLSQMASRQIQFIDHLEKAQMRIENKTYGICRVTGKLIDKARLRAVPHATLSIEAKMGLVKKSENQNVQ